VEKRGPSRPRKRGGGVRLGFGFIEWGQKSKEGKTEISPPKAQVRKKRIPDKFDRHNSPRTNARNPITLGRLTGAVATNVWGKGVGFR